MWGRTETQMDKESHGAKYIVTGRSMQVDWAWMSPAESGVWKVCEWLHGLESNLCECAMLLSIEIGGPLPRAGHERIDICAMGGPQMYRLMSHTHDSQS